MKMVEELRMKNDDLEENIERQKEMIERLGEERADVEGRHKAELRLVLKGEREMEGRCEMLEKENEELKEKIN